MWVDSQGWYWRKVGTHWQYLADDMTWVYGWPHGPLYKTDQADPAPAADVAPIVETGKYEIFRGPQGLKGEKGDRGGPLLLCGDVADYASLPSDLEVADSGKAWLNLADGKLYEWLGAEFPADGLGTTWRGPLGISRTVLVEPTDDYLLSPPDEPLDYDMLMFEIRPPTDTITVTFSPSFRRTVGLPDSFPVAANVSALVGLRWSPVAGHWQVLAVTQEL